MLCTRVQELFSEIYDGIAEDQTILESHIQECPTCTAEYADYSRLISELKKLPMPELPADFHKTVMAKVRAIAVSGGGATGKPELILNKGRNRAFAKANAAARRWAGVAAAACLLLVSLWAVRTFDMAMPERQFDMYAPQAGWADSQVPPAPASAPMPVAEYAAEIPHARVADADDLGVQAIWGDEYPNTDYGWALEYEDFVLADDYGSQVFGQAAPQSVEIATDARDLMRMSANISDYSAYDFTLALTGGQPGHSQGDARAWGAAWDIALAVGLAVLAISLSGVAWSIYRKR